MVKDMIGSRELLPRRQSYLFLLPMTWGSKKRETERTFENLHQRRDQYKHAGLIFSQETRSEFPIRRKLGYYPFVNESNFG